jgi:hypothetical protein
MQNSVKPGDSVSVLSWYCANRDALGLAQNMFSSDLFIPPEVQNLIGDISAIPALFSSNSSTIWDCPNTSRKTPVSIALNLVVFTASNRALTRVVSWWLPSKLASNKVIAPSANWRSWDFPMYVLEAPRDCFSTSLESEKEWMMNVEAHVIRVALAITPYSPLAL